jgi:hypothetical protein
MARLWTTRISKSDWRRTLGVFCDARNPAPNELQPGNYVWRPRNAPECPVGTVYRFTRPTDDGGYSTGYWLETISPRGQITNAEIDPAHPERPEAIKSYASWSEYDAEHPSEEEQYDYYPAERKR